MIRNCLICFNNYLYSKRDRYHRKNLCGACYGKVIKYKLKFKCIQYKGGKCISCGYSKSLRSLTFHHRDSTLKDIDIASTRYKNFDKLKPELDKCDLLCMNCHMELHEDSKIMKHLAFRTEG